MTIFLDESAVLALAEQIMVAARKGSRDAEGKLVYIKLQPDAAVAAAMTAIRAVSRCECSILPGESWSTSIR